MEEFFGTIKRADKISGWRTLRGRRSSPGKVAPIDSLSGAASTPREVAEVLTQGLRVDDRIVRYSAADGLSAAGPEAVVALPLLIQALADPDWAVRGAAVKALGSIGPPAKDALGPLKDLEQREPGRRSAIAESIRKIEGR